MINTNINFSGRTPLKTWCFFRLNCYCAPGVNKGAGITWKICDSAPWLPSQLVLLEGWQGKGGLRKGGEPMSLHPPMSAPRLTDGREVEESQGLCTVRTIAQPMCNRLSGRCVLIGSLFSLAVWRASAEGKWYHWYRSSCEVAWFLALWLCEAPLALSLSLPLQRKAKHGQASSDQAPHGPRAQEKWGRRV